MKEHYRPVSGIRRRYFQTPHRERAALLVDAYLPTTGKLTPARMLLTMRIARTMAMELEPKQLTNRH